jgi:hypothetical protein
VGADLVDAILVRCYPEQDGPTEIVLGDAVDIAPGGVSAFDDNLETPSRALAVTAVDRQIGLETGVEGTRTRIRMWLSHPQWPEKVTIGVG